MRHLGFFFFATLFLFACESGEEWIVYNEVEIAGDWNQEDAIRLALTPANKGSSKVFLEVTHSPDFGFENIYLKYKLSQQGEILTEDLVSIPLMSNDGFWTGKQKGENFSSSQLIGSFDLTKPITLEVQQNSRESRLGGVKAIGVGVQ